MEKDNNNVDLFAWANKVDQFKKQLKIELFVFNKHFTPFRLNLNPDLISQARAWFVYEMAGFVTLGAEKGLEVKDFELEEQSKDTILKTNLGRVERASYLMDFLVNRTNEIVDFSNDEHEFRLTKGIVAKLTIEDSEAQEAQEFYVVKQIMASQAVFGPTAWQLNGSKLDKVTADVSLKVPTDNQTLIIGDEIFVFNQSKFERLFSYDYKKQLIADEKIKLIESRFKLSFPDGLDMQSLIRERKKTVAKLQKLELTEMKQSELIDYADEMQLELMTDNDGAIIIMDGNDLDVFIGLLNEDYMLSSVTNKRFEIVNKKMLGEPDGEPPRG